MIRTIAQSGGSRSRGGVATINFHSAFVSQPHLDALTATAPECSRAFLGRETKPQPRAKPIAWGTIHQLKLSHVNRIPRPPFSALIDHIHQVARIAGIDRLGIG